MISKILNHIDFEKTNALLEGFNESTGFVTAILSLDGKVLSKSGWRQICTDFHRKNPETALNCLVSDTTLDNKMRKEEKYLFYKCMNGLVDVRLPIVIRGQHVANLFSGQFFFEEPDISFFKKQAKTYGFEERVYLEALGKVPVVSKEKVETAMDFLRSITQMIIEMTADKIEQTEINEVIRKNETALLESQVQLEQNIDDLLESQRIAHVGTWRLDLATNQVVWSEELYKMYGFDPAMPPPPYSEHMKLFTPKSWDKLSTSLDRTINCGIPYELELKTVTKDGSNGWMWVRGEAIKDSNGNIVSLRGAAQDITARKKSELEIKKSEERFQILFNKAPIGYQSLDFEGRFIEVNQQWLDTLGFSKDEVIGKWFGDFLCPEYVDAFRQRFPIFKSQGHIHSEFEMLCKDGTQLTISFEGKIGYGADGEFMQTHCILQDITDQRKAEKERKEAEVELGRLMKENQRILDNLQDAYFQADISGNFIIVNPQAVHMFGYSTASELIGQPTTIVYANPDDRIQLIDKLMREGSIADFVTQGFRKDGTAFWVSMNVQFIKDEQGSIIGSEALVRDISERTAMINEIELQRDTLMANNAKLDHLLDQSVKSISMIGELRDVYTAGHQRRVQDLSCAIAKQLGLLDYTIMNLSYGSIIHDIGKIYIPLEILNKPGKISDLEFKIIQTHVEQGYNIVKQIDFPDVIPTMICQHHERLDGSGYPQGLSGEQIIIESRILAVSDVVEAMTSHRPYRAALGIDVALAEISTYKGQKYDCEVVDTCIQLFREKGFKFSNSIADSI